jgi:hypothetical protein
VVKIECQVCHQPGYLQQLGNYFRMRHYAGKNPETGKAKFYYHQQTKEYALSQMDSKQNSKPIDHLTIPEHLNLKDSSLILSGRSLVWLGHQPPTLTTRVQIPATAPKILSEDSSSLLNMLKRV